MLNAEEAQRPKSGLTSHMPPQYAAFWAGSASSIFSPKYRQMAMCRHIVVFSANCCT